MRLRSQKHRQPTSEKFHAYSSQPGADTSKKRSRFTLKAGNRESPLTSPFHNAKASAQDGIEHAPPAGGGRSPADAEELLQQVAAARLASRLPLALELLRRAPAQWLR